MKKVFGKQLGALLLAAVVASMTACGSGNGGASGESSSAKEEGKLTRISMYPADANLSSGVVTGHKAEFFAENGIELEVWAYSDEKTNAILASGDLPDIMYVSTKNLNTMIEGGMLLELDDYLDQMPHVQSYAPMAEALEYARKYRSAGTGKLYGLPLSVGDTAMKVSLTDSTDRNAVKLRWDVYEEIGAPEINNMDDLIDVMEQMVKAHPTDENGNPFYGTVLNSGTDTKFWNCMSLYFQWQGYTGDQLPYLLETDMVNGTHSSILSKDSLYYKGLKWYHEVYKRGLMDPDSINSDRATQATKISEGFAMVPSGSLPGWAPKYFEYYIPGTNIYYDYNKTYGDANKVIAINAKTKNLDACLKLLDMWCDPDAYFRILNGPDGDNWYSDGENAYLTDTYYNYMKEHNGSTQGYKCAHDEESTLWNTSFCVHTGAETKWKDGEGNARLGRMEQWKEVMELSTSNPTFESWKKTTGYDSWKDLIEDKGVYYSESPLKNVDTFCSLPEDSMQLVVDSIKDAVVNASWQMVYAESDEQFDAIWDQMITDCEGLGAQEVIDWRLADIEQAKQARDSLKK